MVWKNCRADETGTGDHGTVKGRKSDGMGSENEQYVIVCKGDCGYRDGLSIMEIKWRRKGGSLERLLPFRNCCLFVVFYKIYYKEKIAL